MTRGSGGEGLTFSSTDGDGITGNDPAELVQTALNASFTVNGLAVQSSSNIVTDVVPGATLTLKKAVQDENVAITSRVVARALVAILPSRLSSHRGS